MVGKAIRATNAPRTKRGAPADEDPSDRSHMKKIWRGVKELNEGFGRKGNHLIPIKVISASNQIVAGRLYRFEVLVGESESPRDSVNAAKLKKSNCKLKEGGSRSLYKIKLYERLWLKYEKFTINKIRDVDANESI
ncbi:hypothetical protein PMAYCL1PPCAC_22932 [Pristionchus mayeri]|uniref:Cystatin domain-containing protein n=1 Tax=Pristionchus mayeri TaxID=1317129 RepID=A0AAN5I567_9BILA|nr:hypothetical protein PMAYCL1PPCAC_22932 [Pristionchus mayeri]